MCPTVFVGNEHAEYITNYLLEQENRQDKCSFFTLIVVCFGVEGVVCVERRETGGDDLDVGVAEGRGGVAVVAHGRQQRPQTVRHRTTEVVANAAESETIRSISHHFLLLLPHQRIIVTIWFCCRSI